MVLVGHPGELLEADAVVVTRVLHARLGKDAGHRLGPEDAVDAGHRSVAACGLEDLLLGLAATTQQAHLAHLLYAEGQAHLRLPGLDREVDGAQGRRPGGTRVGHVEHRYAGLADLLLHPLAHARLGLEERAGTHHVHVVDGHPAVRQRVHARPRGQVDRVQLRVAAEPGHRRSEDPDCVAHS